MIVELVASYLAEEKQTADGRDCSSASKRVKGVYYQKCFCKSCGAQRRILWGGQKPTVYAVSEDRCAQCWLPSSPSCK